MAFKLPQFKILSNIDAKSRLFILFAAVVGISFAVYLAVYFFGNATSTASARVANAPKNLVSVPGGNISPEYQQTVEEANLRRIEEARQQGAGASAIPTVLNVSSSESGCFMCPSPDAPDVNKEIEDLMNKGKLTRETADMLKDLANRNVSIDEYAAALDALVKAGKLTPEEARALLEKYKKQHSNALVNESAKMMDGMIKSGRLPLSTATELLDLQKKQVTPAQYAAELQRLAAEGKISPETAGNLLAQYTQQLAKEGAKEGLFHLQQMAKAGQITPDVLKMLEDLQNRNVPANEYADAVNRLIAEGKVTPAVGNKLIQDYRAGKIGGSAPGVQDVLKAKENALATLKRLMAEGQLPPDAEKLLESLQNQNASLEAYAAALKKLQDEGKISAQTANALLNEYQALKGTIASAGAIGALAAKGGAAGDLAKRLLNLQANNASAGVYADELKKAVQAGIISPTEASALLQQYQASIRPVVGTLPSSETVLPEYAALQQQIQAGAAEAAIPEENFENVEVQTTTQTNDDRIRRIQELQAAMSGQVQNLLGSAWQPPQMAHQGGTYETEKPGEGTGPGGTLPPGVVPGTPAGAATIKKPALIKSGTIFFAVLDTAVDSDYPDTPVMATIIEGKFKGAKLLGKLSLAQGQDKVSLNFTQMDLEDWPSAKLISAYAIDPDTARTVMASEVDNHYLSRWGLLMASSFVQGYSNAITNAGTSTTGIFGTSTDHPDLSPGSKFAVGLGQIGTNLNEIALENMNKPATVKIYAGVGLGILFASEVTDEDTPMKTVTTTTVPNAVTTTTVATTP
jgi:type IV secretory pathway VirB10-like protein/polyhydroxyalkanoate synthesis regulator phasin